MTCRSQIVLTLAEAGLQPDVNGDWIRPTVFAFFDLQQEWCKVNGSVGSLDLLDYFRASIHIKAESLRVLFKQEPTEERTKRLARHLEPTLWVLAPEQ